MLLVLQTRRVEVLADYMQVDVTKRKQTFKLGQAPSFPHPQPIIRAQTCVPHAGDGMIPQTEAQFVGVTALLHHLISHTLHVLQQVHVLRPQSLQTGDRVPRQNQPMVTCLWVLVLDDHHLIIFVHLRTINGSCYGFVHIHYWVSKIFFCLFVFERSLVFTKTAFI